MDALLSNAFAKRTDRDSSIACRRSGVSSSSCEASHSAAKPSAWFATAASAARVPPCPTHGWHGHDRQEGWGHATVRPLARQRGGAEVDLVAEGPDERHRVASEGRRPAPVRRPRSAASASATETRGSGHSSGGDATRSLVAENLVLRHQLAVLRVDRPSVPDGRVARVAPLRSDHLAECRPALGHLLVERAQGEPSC